MSATTVVHMVLGIAALIVGANLLVSGAASVAIGLGIHPVVVGLTVVAFGTSAPELAVSVDASRSGEVDVALGNVIGSSIANVLLILGLAGVAGGVSVPYRVRYVELPFLVAVSAGVVLLAVDGGYRHVDGAVLLAIFTLYAVWIVRTARRERRSARTGARSKPSPEVSPVTARSLAVSRILAGLVMLAIGAGWLVASAETTALAFGVSEVVVGLTVVAIGTSVPELATTIVAVRRGESDLAVGNAVGSNLFNVLAALGVAILLSPAGIAVDRDVLFLDLPVMVAAALALWLLVRRSGILRARAGTWMAVSYALYLVVVVAVATGA